MHPQSTSSTPKRTPVRNRTSKKITLVCATCDQPFDVYRYDAEKRARAYCSNTCHAEVLRISMPPKEEIEALYKGGCSTNALARHYCVSKGLIYNWLKEYGIVTRTNGQGVALAQTGTLHHPEWNAAIKKAWDFDARRRDAAERMNERVRDGDIPTHSRSRGGRRASLGGLYVRSTWECNYALYLNFLVKRGAILRWEYEPDTFEFHRIKRGHRFYTPDFKVFLLDGTVEYHEVKGYLDQASRTKLSRMARYYPAVRIVLVDGPAYKAIARQVKPLIPEWETARRKGGEE